MTVMPAHSITQTCFFKSKHSVSLWKINCCSLSFENLAKILSKRTKKTLLHTLGWSDFEKRKIAHLPYCAIITLFKNNYWGISGAGDCDCFSILVLAMCVAHGWNKQEIILAGRSKLMPVHIWTVVYVDGKRYSMDLTNAYCNVERNYKFTQVLPV